MFDLSYDNILHSNLINFAILLIILILLMKKLRVSQRIKARISDVLKEISNSDEKKAQSIEYLNKVKKELDVSDQEVKEIIDRANVNLDNMRLQISKETEKSKEKIERVARESIQSYRDSLVDKVRKNLSKAASDLAMDSIKSSLEVDKSLHDRFIEECIKDIDRLDLR